MKQLPEELLAGSFTKYHYFVVFLWGDVGQGGCIANAYCQPQRIVDLKEVNRSPLYTLVVPGLVIGLCLLGEVPIGSHICGCNDPARIRQCISTW